MGAVVVSGELFRLHGVIEALDGSRYRPLLWGRLELVERCEWALVEGCRERGDGFDLTIDRGPHTAATGHTFNGGPKRVPAGPFEVVELLEAVEGATREDRDGDLSYPYSSSGASSSGAAS